MTTKTSIDEKPSRFNVLIVDRDPIDTHRKEIKTKLNLRNGAQLSRAAFQWVHEDH